MFSHRHTTSNIIPLLILAYVLFVSLYFGARFVPSSNQSKSSWVGIPSFMDAPITFSSSSSTSSSFSVVTVDSLINQLRSKLLEDNTYVGQKIKSSNSNNAKLDTSSDSSSNRTKSSGSGPLLFTQRSILCCVALNEEAYIDEFVDYHLGIGFRKVIVYDNSDHYELKQWGDKRNQRRRRKRSILQDGNNNDNDTTATITNTSAIQGVSYYNATESNEVHVIHYTGKGKQSESYLDCAKRATNGEFGSGIKYAAFWDVDEFLVLKQHNTVDELADEYMIEKGASALSINWYMFQQGDRHVYEPLPVTKRFVYRLRQIPGQVKSIALLEHMHLQMTPHPHYPRLTSNGTMRIDTNGTQLTSMWNGDGPDDVAVIHHYKTKSYAEYVKKRERGRAAVKNWNPDDQSAGYKMRVNEATNEFVQAMRTYNQTDSSFNNGDDELLPSKNGVVYDDSAWIAMKRVCPKYALYDLLDEV